MKTTMTFWILGLLWLGLSCKKPVEPVVPPVVTQPPSTTTTPPSSTTTTPPSSTTTTGFYIPTPPVANYDNVPQPPDGCRIVRTVYKTVTLIPPFLNAETVTIGEKTAIVHTNTITTYTYDRQGRLIKDRRQHWRGQIDSLVYKYLPERVWMEEATWDYASKYYFTRTDTFYLDNRNLAVRITTSLRQGIFSTSSYNADGFQVKYESSTGGTVDTHTIKDKNIVQQSRLLDGGFGTTSVRLEYYLSRSNLPELTQFEGRNSQNLLLKRVLSSAGSLFYPSGDVFQQNYYYEFDSRGRVKRQIVYSYSLNPGWPYQTDSGGIGITDFEYECP